MESDALTKGLSTDELLTLAKAGYLMLKTETNNNAEALAVMQLIHTLFMLEGQNG